MMRFFERFKKKNVAPLPPEPAFLDSPEGFEKMRFRAKDLLEIRWVKWGGVVLLIIFVALILMPHSSKRKVTTGSVTSAEKRLTMTAMSMGQAIETASKPARNEEPERPLKIQMRTKRKFDSKIAVFLREPAADPKSTSQKERVEKLKLKIPSGTKIPAFLEDRVFSFNVEAPVLAVLAKDFLVQEKVVIPKGSKFVGEANVLKSLDRINVRFHLLVLPDGRELRVNAMALSEDGAAGIKGKTQKYTDLKVLKAIGESVLSVGSLFLGRGSSTDAFNLQDQLRLNVAQNLSDDAQRSLQGVKIDKSVTVEGGKPVFVFLLEAL
ncbi:MAG: TrbI/VirB10 family protein [Candidatus Omnitrophota bacterium]